MASILPFQSHLRSPIARVGAFAVGMVFLFAVAAMFGPGGTRATTVEPHLPSQQTAAEVQRLRGVQKPALMGTLSSRNHRIDVYMSRKGAQYTVLTTDGIVLAELLSSDELYARFPELDITSMQARSIGQVDPPNED